MGIIGLIILAIAAYIIYAVIQGQKGQLPENIIGHWNQYIPDLQFSSLEFYDSLERILQERKIPDIVITRLEFYERGTSVAGRKRIYLRVRNAPYMFDVCAAPYGTGFFVSWWFGESLGCLIRMLFFIPFLGGYLKNRILTQTYYKMDTEDMFQEATHRAVMEALDAITKEKGLRGLSDSERQTTRRRL